MTTFREGDETQPEAQGETPRTDDVYAMFLTLLNEQDRQTVSRNTFEAIGDTVKSRMGQLERELADAKRGLVGHREVDVAGYLWPNPLLAGRRTRD